MDPPRRGGPVIQDNRTSIAAFRLSVATLATRDNEVLALANTRGDRPEAMRSSSSPSVTYSDHSGTSSHTVGRPSAVEITPTSRSRSARGTRSAAIASMVCPAVAGSLIAGDRARRPISERSRNARSGSWLNVRPSPVRQAASMRSSENPPVTRATTPPSTKSLPTATSNATRSPAAEEFRILRRSSCSRVAPGRSQVTGRPPSMTSTASPGDPTAMPAGYTLSMTSRPAPEIADKVALSCIESNALTCRRRINPMTTRATTSETTGTITDTWVRSPMDRVATKPKVNSPRQAPYVRQIQGSPWKRLSRGVSAVLEYSTTRKRSEKMILTSPRMPNPMVRRNSTVRPLGVWAPVWILGSSTPSATPIPMRNNCMAPARSGWRARANRIRRCRGGLCLSERPRAASGWSAVSSLRPIRTPVRGFPSSSPSQVLQLEALCARGKMRPSEGAFATCEGR